MTDIDPQTVDHSQGIWLPIQSTWERDGNNSPVHFQNRGYVQALVGGQTYTYPRNIV